MRSVMKWVVLFFVLFAAGCGSLGPLEKSTDQVSVYTGEKIKADTKKREVLQEENGVGLLHYYVSHYVNRNRIRKSLELDITITSLRISFGRDHMSTETVVMENGKEIDRFTSVSTTSRGNHIKRFTKDLAKQIVIKAREY